MKKYIISCVIIMFLISTNALAFTKQRDLKLNPAKECTNLACVRDNIDLVDSEIIKLIGLRLTYVKRAGELKKGKQPIHDQAREEQVIAKVTQLAVKNGYPGSIASEIYKTLLTQTNIYEKSNKY